MLTLLRYKYCNLMFWGIEQYLITLTLKVLLKSNYFMSIIKKIDGNILHQAFIAGGTNILNNQAEINSINVFPVMDQDTGTNMASTVRAIIDNSMPARSFKTTVNSIAEAALEGARGNSGVIFAQFIYGFSCEVNNKSVITTLEFANSLKKSIPYIYNAIDKPVEGTILTVIKEWVNYIYKQSALINNFKELFFESLEVLKNSLNETTKKLDVLKKYNFVDAGAKSFVIFIEGVISYINNKKSLVKVNSDSSLKLTNLTENVELLGEFRYCTEAILCNMNIDIAELNKQISGYGDSLVIAGSKNKCRIHIHTNNPSKLFSDLNNFSTITNQKVDDMKLQNEIVKNRKWNIALVTDSSCDLSKSILDKYQIHVVPLNLNFGENKYLDKVTISPDTFYDLLEKSDEFPSTSQVNENSFINVYSRLLSNYDSIISLHLTGKFSGTYSNALKASKKVSERFDKPVYVFDSLNLSGGLGLMVYKTALNIANNIGFEQIMELLEGYRNNTEIFVSVKNLNSMIKGGRVSKPKGIIANFLGLNPVVSMSKDGSSRLFGKTFSQKSSLKKIIRYIEKIHLSETITDYIILHARNFKGAEELSDKMTGILNFKPVDVVNISPVIGMHAGSGALSVAISIKSK